jgi:hypothetical protein
VNDGELVGYGYSPKPIDSLGWQRGVYPDQVFEFNGAQDNARVLGYYVTDKEGRIMFSENFPSSSENPDNDPGFVIGKQGDRITVGMRLNLFVAQAEDAVK